MLWSSRNVLWMMKLFPTFHQLFWGQTLSNIWFLFLCLLAEVTVPLSLKEVGGYIEKQVAYLSGEASLTQHPLSAGLVLIWLSDLLFEFLVAKVKLWNLTDCPFYIPRGPRGRLQCHHHAPRMLSFQWHSRGSFSQSLYVPHAHPSVRPALSIPVRLSLPLPFLQCTKKPSACILSTAGLKCPSSRCVKCPPHVLCVLNFTPVSDLAWIWWSSGTFPRQFKI